MFTARFLFPPRHSDARFEITSAASLPVICRAVGHFVGGRLNTFAKLKWPTMSRRVPQSEMSAAGARSGRLLKFKTGTAMGDSVVEMR